MPRAATPRADRPGRRPFGRGLWLGLAILAIGLGGLRLAHARPATPAKASTVDHDPYWEQACREVGPRVAQLLAPHHHRGLVYGGTAARKEVALTFDDGPHPEYTPKLLALLKQYDVKATFFVVGKMAERHPELVRAEVAAGHELGNHTYHHVNLTRLSAEEVAEELQACDDVLHKITGEHYTLFRPPGGDLRREVLAVADAMGYRTVLWTANSGDYRNAGGTVEKRRVYRRLERGGIILMHDGAQDTLKVLPEMIARLRAEGYRFVTVRELIGRE
jgi:peptidoglycan-N-acetylglucosamine deacetylase